MIEHEFTHRGQPYKVSIRECDVERKHVRGSGPGGQHRNKVETGVRLTHVPSGVTGQATDSRSQDDNAAEAMRRLLVTFEALIRRNLDVLHRRKVTASFGKADRTYVLDKDRRVVDHRSGHAEPDPARVLGGDLDGFIRAGLTHHRDR